MKMLLVTNNISTPMLRYPIQSCNESLFIRQVKIIILFKSEIEFQIQSTSSFGTPLIAAIWRLAAISARQGSPLKISPSNQV